MQAISVKRYTHPETHGYAGTIEPKDGSWILYVRNGDDPPELWVQVEAPEDENDLEGPTITGYTPAIFMNDKLMDAIAAKDMDGIVGAMGCPAPKES